MFVLKIHFSDFSVDMIVVWIINHAPWGPTCLLSLTCIPIKLLLFNKYKLLIRLYNRLYNTTSVPSGTRREPEDLIFNRNFTSTFTVLVVHFQPAISLDPAGTAVAASSPCGSWIQWIRGRGGVPMEVFDNIPRIFNANWALECGVNLFFWIYSKSRRDDVKKRNVAFSPQRTYWRL